MDEENTMAINEEVEEQTTPDTTPVSENETAEEVEETPVESTEETEVEETETDGQKKGFTQRVRELNSKAKEAERRAALIEAENQSLAKRIAELTGSYESREQEFSPPPIQPGMEYTQEQYQQHVAAAAGSIVDLKLKQQGAINRIQNETSEVIRSYPELDPKSESFDKDLSESVTEAVEAKVRANPYSANVKSFVDGLMKPYKRAVTKEVGRVSENLVRQVSQAATRPTSIHKSDKPLAEKSIQELERELGIVQS